ncbi:MAG: DUF2752 domain-containing protein [Bacteroidales bacterium]|jgi:hypothetical protein|nr:DUF2752 domain-containing protein [Bacteroidales bacterium]
MKILLRTGLLTVTVTLAVLFFVLDPSEYVIFPRCPFNILTGYYCPGCGSQRAIHSLLHLNFTGVAGNNFLLIPAVALIIYSYTYSFINRFFGLKLPNIFYMKNMPWVIFFVIGIFGILRNLPYYPFLLLAPN